MKLVDRLRSMLQQAETPRVDLPPVESTRDELRVARVERLVEHRRTERLAALLDDYRRADEALRRR